MSTVFKTIIVAMFAWAGLVSLITGEISIRTSVSRKGPIPRWFGLCMLLAAAILSLYWLGLVPEAIRAVAPVLTVILLAAALILVWLS